MRRRALVFAALIIAILLLIGVYFFILQSTNNSVLNSAPISNGYIITYPTQNNETAPNAIAVDSQGTIWFTLQNESFLMSLFPGNATMHEYHIPMSSSSGSVTWGIAVDNSRHIVWFTEQLTNAIWSFDMNTQKFTEYALKTTDAFPFNLALDKQGNVWFTEIFGQKIGEITTSGNLTEFPIPLASQYLEPSGIAVSSNGTVWFTLPAVGDVASFAAGKFSFYNVSHVIVDPLGVAIDKNGDLWLTQHGPSFFTEFNPSTGLFRTMSTSIPSPPLSASYPYFDHVSSNGDVWINEHYGNSIAVFDPANQTLTEYHVPLGHAFPGDLSGILTMTLSPKNEEPWFTEYFTGKVATVNNSKPVDLQLNIANNSGLYGQPLKINNDSDISLGLVVKNIGSENVTLQTSVGNFSQSYKFEFQFSTTSSKGSFNSELLITNKGSTPGVYFITVSAVTDQITVSRVIQVSVS